MTRIWATVALTFFLGAGPLVGSVAAEDRPCDEIFWNEANPNPGCFSQQYFHAMHTGALEAAVRADESKGGPLLVTKFMKGDAVPAGPRKLCMQIWMAPEWFEDDPDRPLPLNQIRVVKFHGYDPNRSTEKARWNYTIEKTDVELYVDEVPVVEDPRYPQIGEVKYILSMTSGALGGGWNMPDELRQHIFMTQTCACDELGARNDTSYPNRRAGYTIVHTPAEFDDLELGSRKSWQYGESAMLFR